MEVIHPLADNQFATTYYTSLDDQFTLESIEVTLLLSKVYARVFPYNERQDAALQTCCTAASVVGCSAHTV